MKCHEHGGKAAAEQHGVRYAARTGALRVKLDAVLFDLDGTLADTEVLGHRPAYNRAFRELGLPFRWGPKLYRKLLKQPGGEERLLHYLQRYRPELGPHAAQVQADPRGWVHAVHQLKSRYFRRLLRRGRVPLRPGVARLMGELHAAGLRIGIVTSASRPTLRAVLRHALGDVLAAQVELVVGGEEVARKKPAPDLYLAALARLGLPAARCVAIEDSAMGLAAASAAGIPTIITANANTAHEDFSRALLVLDSLGEPNAPARVLQGRLDEGHVTVATLLRLGGDEPALDAPRAAAG